MPKPNTGGESEDYQLLRLKSDYCLAHSGVQYALLPFQCIPWFGDLAAAN